MLYDANLEGEFQAIADVQQNAEVEMLMKTNVVGLGISHKIKNGKETGDPSLTFFVENKLDKSALTKDQMIPATVGKFKTDVVESGVIFAGSDISLNNRVRPAKGGYSVGHYKITAGTIATCVKDKIPAMGVTNKYYILSNNHVLANTNDAMLNDPILQPGSFDGGAAPADIIARLSRFVPIRFTAGSTNFVDCAIAEGNFDDLDREIYWNGFVNSVKLPVLNMEVQKTGRTTGHTTGKITAINATVNVNYGAGRVANFSKQIITTAMSAGGDSGSLIIDNDNNAVGLLFAGSPAITIANPIGYVLSALGIKFL